MGEAEKSLVGKTHVKDILDLCWIYARSATPGA